MPTLRYGRAGIVACSLGVILPMRRVLSLEIPHGLREELDARDLGMPILGAVLHRANGEASAMTVDVDKVVMGILQKLRLLDTSGTLLAVDSLSAIDLVQELEAAFELSIPSSAIEMEKFKSVESISAFARDLVAGEF